MVAARPHVVTPRDVVRILFRHRRKMAAFFLAAIAATLLTIALYPRSYLSESKLFLRIGRESVALDPTATTGETILLQKTQADEINSAQNILISRNVLERVVEKVGAERILADAPTTSVDATPATEVQTSAVRRITDSASSGFRRLLESLRLADPGSSVDLAVRRVQRGMNVWAPKEAMVISVSYSAASPELAHDVVEAITNVFLEEHVRLSQTEGSLAFFSEQVDKLHGDLVAAQTELRDRKNAYQMTATTADRQSIVEKVNAALRQKLYDLQLQESELKSRYTDNYPPLKEVRRQRDEAEQSLTTLAQAPVKEATASIVDVEKLNTQEYELAQLERKVELLDGKYRMHVEKLEQARVNDALGREQISNVMVAQPATLVGKPESPKKPLIAALGLLIATTGAFGIAFLAEGLDQTLRTTDQVESQLGLPVLLSIPERKQKRRRLGAASGTTSSRGCRPANDPINPHRLSTYRLLVGELLSGGYDNASSGTRQARTIGVIGCDASKSRSRVAAGLAVQAATSGAEPVLLIDADARRRRVTKHFDIKGSPGWREVLAGEADAEQCVHRQQVGNLAVMSPGAPNGRRHDTQHALVKGSLGQLNEIKADYGLVVVDIPAIRTLGSSPDDTQWLDEAVLVVEAERTRIQAALRTRDLLNRAGVHVTGVVLANRREYIPRWLYQRL